MENRFNNMIEIERMLQFLDIQEVTTKRQKKNGTREFELPIKTEWSKRKIRVASFASGYVRCQLSDAYCSYQLNKRVDGEPTYYPVYEWCDEKNMSIKTDKFRKFTTRTCVLIPEEQDRLAYLISYCLKNYYIKGANQVASGDYIPKWKYEDDIKNAVVENTTPEVKVIVNGHRYNVI